MSAVASSWVATIKVGNQTAKQLLQFYASHNFNKPGFEFKIKTLADQLEVKERTIQRAIQLLVDKKLIIKEDRFNKEGQQITNIIYLNIPQEFVDNFFGEGDIKTSPPRHKDTPRGDIKTPLNNKINNKENKRESIARKKRAPLPDDFILNDQNKIKCKEKGIDIAVFTVKFRLKHKGKTNDDWQNEAAIWIETERTPNSSIVKQELHSNIIEYGPGHPTWEANQEWKRKTKGIDHGRDHIGRNSLF